VWKKLKEWKEKKCFLEGQVLVAGAKTLHEIRKAWEVETLVFRWKYKQLVIYAS